MHMCESVCVCFTLIHEFQMYFMQMSLNESAFSED